MQPMFTFDDESARTAGAGGASETGAYAGNISAAIFTTGRDSQSEAMEFSIDSDVGKINYLRINYKGREGQPLKHGAALINAIMGLTKVKQLNAVEMTNGDGEIELHCKELEGKPIGFVLQKILYTKNDGGDGYKFDVKQVFGANTRKTYKEAIDNTPAEAVAKLLAVLKDKDERIANDTPQHSGSQQQRSMLGNNANQQPQSRLQQASANRQNQSIQSVPDFDDDIPF
ncbi:Uncharacterised protein [Serratia liquefaciens]|uniref:hypothetical protein n=1 Tax=Serratia liquefaciens TaxID=614 RepID=UPI002179E704|nr:hypothetical protein [Serratia liquefaciens]CAI1214320.1 Uncharacterised protein [Serratia liquefaciens]CAI1850651.1 Uncharacterised protein [Serratia liquefaciens]